MYGNRILEDILQCSYQPLSRDFVTGAIIELQNISNTTQFFKLNRNVEGFSETILCSKFVISVPLSDKMYDIPIIIYLGRNFPIDPPEIYLERTSKELAVSSKNYDVDPNTLKIHVQSLKLWVAYKSKVTSVINDIVYSFKSNFPIYKKTTNTQTIHHQNSYNPQVQTQVPYKPPTYSNTNICPSQGLYSNTSQYQQGEYQYVNSNINPTQKINYNPGINPNIQSHFGYQAPNQFGYQAPIVPTQSFQNINIYQQQPVNNMMMTQKLSPEDLRRNLIEELLISLKPKILEEMNNQSNYDEKFSSFLKDISNQNNSLRNFIEKKDEILNTVKEQITKLDEDIKILSFQINGQKNTSINSNTIDFFFKTSNRQLLEIISAEANIEEFITLTKKIVEKGSVSLQEAIRFIRGLSRELYKLRYFRDKLIRVTSK